MHPDLTACLARLTEHHSRLCPRQVLGVRMGLHAADLLDVAVDPASNDRRLLAVVETDGRFADAVSVATGCWLGRRTLRLVDHGKVAVTVVDVRTERSVRLRPHPLARERAAAYAPNVASRWQVQLLAYQVMPAEDLLSTDRVALVVPIGWLLGRAGQRTLCAVCGEEVCGGKTSREATSAILRHA